MIQSSEYQVEEQIFMQSYIPRTLFEVDNADMEKDIEKMKNGNGSELFYQLLTGMDLVMKKRKEELYLKEEEEYLGIYEMMLWNLRKITPEQDLFLSSCTFEELCEKCSARPTYSAREVVKTETGNRVADVQKEFGFDLLPSRIALADYELELSNKNDKTAGFKLSNVIAMIEEQ